MTETGYALGMSKTDPIPVNTKALEGFVRAFDRVVMGKCGGAVEIPKPDPGFPKFEQQVYYALMAEKQREQRKRAHRLSFWKTFPPLNAVRRFIDGIRLRKYNREWLKNNTH